jgi:single-strand DNA-binding protein
MVNKVFLLGNVGKDPELKYLGSGTALCKFSVATTERLGKTDQGQKREHTEWHRCTAWGKLAEIIGQWVTKGCKVHIEGHMRNSKYTDKSGVERESLEIVVDQIDIITWGKKATTTTTQTAAAQSTPPPSGAAQNSGPASNGPPPGSAPPPANSSREAEEISLEDGEF